jgi:hypothetical protein
MVKIPQKIFFSIPHFTPAPLSPGDSFRG